MFLSKYVVWIGLQPCMSRCRDRKKDPPLSVGWHQVWVLWLFECTGPLNFTRLTSCFLWDLCSFVPFEKLFFCVQCSFLAPPPSRVGSPQFSRPFQNILISNIWWREQIHFLCSLIDFPGGELDKFKGAPSSLRSIPRSELWEESFICWYRLHFQGWPSTGSSFVFLLGCFK